ncbi:hypothetical protein GCM10022389_19880 [Flavobacterium cheonanense]|uniref:Uncharacterized protein n=2 Tax=Flavobacterium cheonanense TaxID=706183 RepID=A0ABP7VTP4_9FLAO
MFFNQKPMKFKTITLLLIFLITSCNVIKKSNKIDRIEISKDTSTAIKVDTIAVNKGTKDEYKIIFDFSGLTNELFDDEDVEYDRNVYLSYSDYYESIIKMDSINTDGKWVKRRKLRTTREIIPDNFFETKRGKEMNALFYKMNKKYIEIPDINFEKQLIKLKLDTILDHSVLISNVENIDSLNISSPKNDKIKSIKGIEAFKKLRILDCVGNDIKELDFSSNLLLEHLSCSHNENLKKLVTSNNINLKYLSIGSGIVSHNDIPNVLYLDFDISKNIKLKSFFAMMTFIPKIDFSFNPNLDEISIMNCQAEEINISNNNNLEFIRVESNHSLKYLDFKNKPDLEFVLCNFNAIEKIDLSYNEKLTWLTCDKNKVNEIIFPANSKLETVSCNTNLIKNIDLASSKNLKYLDIQNNLELKKIILYKKLPERMPYPTDYYFGENETKSIEKQVPSDCLIKYMQNE